MTNETRCIFFGTPIALVSSVNQLYYRAELKSKLRAPSKSCVETLVIIIASKHVLTPLRMLGLDMSALQFSID